MANYEMTQIASSNPFLDEDLEISDCTHHADDMAFLDHNNASSVESLPQASFEGQVVDTQISGPMDMFEQVPISAAPLFFLANHGSVRCTPRGLPPLSDYEKMSRAEVIVAFDEMIGMEEIRFEDVLDLADEPDFPSLSADERREALETFNTTMNVGEDVLTRPEYDGDEMLNKSESDSDAIVITNDSSRNRDLTDTDIEDVSDVETIEPLVESGDDDDERDEETQQDEDGNDKDNTEAETDADTEDEDAIDVDMQGANTSQKRSETRISINTPSAQVNMPKKPGLATKNARPQRRVQTVNPAGQVVNGVYGLIDYTIDLILRTDAKRRYKVQFKPDPLTHIIPHFEWIGRSTQFRISPTVLQQFEAMKGAECS